MKRICIGLSNENIQYLLNGGTMEVEHVPDTEVVIFYAENDGVINQILDS